MAKSKNRSGHEYLGRSHPSQDFKVRLRFIAPEFEFDGKIISDALLEFEAPLSNTFDDFLRVADSSKTAGYDDANNGRIKLRKHNNRTLLLGSDIIEFFLSLPLYVPKGGSEDEETK